MPFSKYMHGAEPSPELPADLLHSAGHTGSRVALDRASRSTASAGLCGRSGSGKACSHAWLIYRNRLLSHPFQKDRWEEPLGVAVTGRALVPGTQRVQRRKICPESQISRQRASFHHPLEPGSLIWGGDAPQRGEQKKEKERCITGAQLVARPLGAPMLNRSSQKS